MPHQHHKEKHAHDHHVPHTTKALRLAFFLNLGFTLIEAGGGIWTGSIAILTDALHDLGDSVVLGAAWYLQNLSQRGRDARYSYGYGRYSMLGGWLAAGVLIVGSLVAFAFAVPRLLEPELPYTGGMIIIAVFGLVMNSLAAWFLNRGSSLNERGAYLHLMEDVLGWAAVLIGSIIMHFTGFAYLDPLMSIGISAFILYNAIGTLREGTKILMQAQPHEVDPVEMGSVLKEIPGVVGVHDQHSWTLDGQYTIHSMHLVVQEMGLEKAVGVKTMARDKLKELGIDHTTIEIELPGEDCGLEDH